MISENLVANAPSIKSAIERFFAERFAPASHLDNVVMDVAFLGRDPFSQPYDVKLVEINSLDLSPFGTDPCLFQGDEDRIGSLENSFRYFGDGTHAPAPACDYASLSIVEEEPLRTYKA